MNNKNEQEIEDINIFDCIEFDLSEALKDLIYGIKSLKKDVNEIKNHLNLQWLNCEKIVPYN